MVSGIMRDVLSTNPDRKALRDEFALAALVGIGGWLPGPVVESGKWPEPSEVQRRRAEWAYAQADAMLEARDR